MTNPGIRNFTACAIQTASAPNEASQRLAIRQAGTLALRSAGVRACRIASVLACLHRCSPCFRGTPVVFILAAILLHVAPACAGTWAERAGQLNRTEVSAEEARKRGADEDKDARNKICVRSIKPAMPGVDWNTDPTAIPYMLYQIGKRTDLPIYTRTDGLDVATDELFEHTVIYLTSHGRWSFNEKETENLARWIERGGTLLLDDCYLRGSPFADSVRPEVSKMIPGSEPRMLFKDDPIVADSFRMIYPTPWPGEADFENRTWQYFLCQGRPAVFFGPNDDGCGWEISSPPSASNPIGEGIGHGGDNRQRETMYQWMTNWILFAYTH